MSFPTGSSQAVVPAHLGFLAIYNPSLGNTDDTIEDQIVYYSSSEPHDGAAKAQSGPNPPAVKDAIREQKNEQLRQIGLAQGMVEFGKSFSDGRSVDTVETSKSRIILHELESGWWILASINLTILPGKAARSTTGMGKAQDGNEILEYSSREVKPAILLLGDLLQAHSTFLLHHAASLSALFVRTKRSKFMGILSRYWDTFLPTWNVLLHGNPANNLYGGIKIAACGELGMGVGEEERGSGEREVLEGFVGRIDGLVDVIVSKFGDGIESNSGNEQSSRPPTVQWAPPTAPWLGSGNEPAAEDGAIFLGTGALSRKSLRDVSHWMEDLYRWGDLAYGIMDNPTSNRRTKRSKGKAKGKTLSPEAKQKSREVYGLSPVEDTPPQDDGPSPLNGLPAASIQEPVTQKSKKKRRPSLDRGPSSYASTSTDSDSSKAATLMQYLKFGYGKHWSLGGGLSAIEEPAREESSPQNVAAAQPASHAATGQRLADDLGLEESAMYPRDDSVGHYLIGLLGDIEDDSEERADVEESAASRNSRLLLRTLTVELEREEDARAENEISIDLGSTENDRASSHGPGSERTGTSKTSFDSQDRNKTKKLRVVVYVKKPFIFALLFDLRASSLALNGLYRSLHHQIGPLIKPLLASTAYRASKPDLGASGTDDSNTPIYNLIWNPSLLTVNSTIPNIPDPHLLHTKSSVVAPWTRVEAINTHIQIINTYIASMTDDTEREKTCKTSRGWWIVWNKVANPESSISDPYLASGKVKTPHTIAEDDLEPQSSRSPSSKRGASRGTSSPGASLGSGPAHPFLDTPSGPFESTFPKEKEIFLIRRASDHVAARSSNRFTGRSVSGGDTSDSGRLAQGIGIDTKRYIESLLNFAG
ncbi:hypothetical protein B0O99DRAFT_510101 [Bisporella sp. PMI_857]|nr:hypothetical protein B0O99DRAFT_510101 [Bisporella sp. PMI_857]